VAAATTTTPTISGRQQCGVLRYPGCRHRLHVTTDRALDGNILEDRIVSTTGAIQLRPPFSPSAGWIMQMAAFKAAGSGGDTTSPTTPTGLTVTAASASQINLSWTASTDNVGVTDIESSVARHWMQHVLLRSGARGHLISYTGLSASTSYACVRATDAAGNLSGIPVWCRQLR